MYNLDFEVPLNRYLLRDIAEVLKKSGIGNLDDLTDYLYTADRAWRRGLPLTEQQANGLLSWLWSKRSNGVSLPESLIKEAQDLGKSFYASRTKHQVHAQTWQEVISPASPGAQLVLPLERFKISEAFNGAHGTNRAAASECALKATNDLEAIEAWLKARASNPNTLNVYRRESERFVLWCVLEKRTALSSVGLEDCADYLRWLEMLGRCDETEWSKHWILPQNQWIGPKNTGRASLDWRPFNCAQSYTSRKASVTALRLLFAFLHKTGYLRWNPLDQVSAKVRFLPGEGKPKEFADRSLNEAQWQEITAYLDSRDEGPVKTRLKVALMLGKELGMRASEMTAARASWLEKREIADEEVTVINIIGKGGKVRRLPLSPEQVSLIQSYFTLRGLPEIDDPSCADEPLLASLRKRGSKGLSRSGLYVVLHDFLEEVAAGLGKDRRVDQHKLRASSLHWLRHTFAVASLKKMPINVVQNAMGHASIKTTSAYIVPEEQAILKGMRSAAKDDYFSR